MGGEDIRCPGCGETTPTPASFCRGCGQPVDGPTVIDLRQPEARDGSVVVGNGGVWRRGWIAVAGVGVLMAVGVIWVATTGRESEFAAVPDVEGPTLAKAEASLEGPIGLSRGEGVWPAPDQRPQQLEDLTDGFAALIGWRDVDVSHRGDNGDGSVRLALLDGVSGYQVDAVAVSSPTGWYFARIGDPPVIELSPEDGRSVLTGWTAPPDTVEVRWWASTEERELYGVTAAGAAVVVDSAPHLISSSLLVAYNATGEPNAVAGGDSFAFVEVPDVEGRTLTEAQATLRSVQLRSGPVGDRDPDSPDAVVVNQEPPAETNVATNSFIGFRTAIISTELCAAMNELPRRTGGARSLAAKDGFLAMLRKAEPNADPPLEVAIRDVLDTIDRGGDIDVVPGTALDSITIHHDACTMPAP